MATIIDALVVTLGLDNSKFKQGVEQNKQDVQAAKMAAASAAKEMEARGKQAAEFFSQIRNQAIALFAVFTAGRGIKDFIRDVTNSDAAAGRMAQNLGISTSALQAWQGAATRAGGSSEGITNSLYGLTQQFQQMALTGTSTVIPYFRALGVTYQDYVDKAGNVKDMNGLLIDIGNKMHAMPAARAHALGAGFGWDRGTVDFLRQGGDAIRSLLDEQHRLGVATDADAKRAQQFQNSLADLQQSVMSVARSIVNELTPYIVEAAKAVERWLEATDKTGRSNKQWLTDTVINALREFRDLLISLPWARIEKDVLDFAHGVDDATYAIGGWKVAVEAVFALWLGGKFLGVLGNVRTLAGALGLLTGGNAAGGVAGGGIIGWLLRKLGPLMLLSAVGAGPIDADDPDLTPQQRAVNKRAKNTVDDVNKADRAKFNNNPKQYGWFHRVWNSITGQSNDPYKGTNGLSDVVLFGDSIAQGIHNANRTQGGGVRGASPKQILDYILADKTDLTGKNVTLSSGVSNNPMQIALVAQQLQALRARGAANINLVGVGSKYGTANDQLAEIAKDNGAHFTGVLKTGDNLGVHPDAKGYRGLGLDFGWAADAETQKYKPLLDLLGKTEGTDKGRGYNETLGYGAYTGGAVNLTGMTLDQVKQLQTQMLADPSNTMHSSAVGRYQITRTTLEGLMKDGGLKGDELFDQKMQDKLAISLIKRRARAALGSVNKFQDQLAHEWASLPSAETGLGVYAGQRRPGTTTAALQAAINGLSAGNSNVASAGRPAWFHDLPSTRSVRDAGGVINHNDNSQSQVATINGPITVHTQATDANGIAGDMMAAVRRRAFAAQANTGLA